MLEIGLYGLGRMGGNMARRLARGGARVAACNRSFAATERLAAEEAGVIACRSLDEMAAALAPPRVVWLM
jgi:6-phosphogluconate dehydrogenase